MKSIDFTQPGGFPLTQDQLDYLQQAYMESITALGALGGNAADAFIVRGAIVVNPSPGTYMVSDGWFMYGGELIHIPPGTLGGVTAGHDVYIQIAQTATPLTFNNGSTPNVILNKTASLVSLTTGTADDATKFLAAHLKPFGAGFGINNRQQVWNALTVSTPAADGGVTGTISYKKDFTTNTLHIRGLLAANNAQNFAASPGSLYSLMGVLPAGYIPSNSVYFSAYYFIAGLILDDLATSWIKQINCTLNNGGQIYFNWIKPDPSIAGYGVNFNAILPLD